MYTCLFSKECEENNTIMLFSILPVIKSIIECCMY